MKDIFKAGDYTQPREKINREQERFDVGTSTAKLRKEMEEQDTYTAMINNTIRTERLVNKAALTEQPSTSEMINKLNKIGRIDKNDIIRAAGEIISYAQRALKTDDIRSDEIAKFNIAIEKTQEACSSIIDALIKNRGNSIAIARKYIKNENSAERHILRVVLKNMDSNNNRDYQDTSSVAGPSHLSDNLRALREAAPTIIEDAQVSHSERQSVNAHPEASSSAGTAEQVRGHLTEQVYQRLQKFMGYAKAGKFPDDAFSMVRPSKKHFWTSDIVKDLITDWNEPRTFEQLEDLSKELLQNSGEFKAETRASLLSNRDKLLTSKEVKFIQGMMQFTIEDPKMKVKCGLSTYNVSQRKNDSLRR